MQLRVLFFYALTTCQLSWSQSSQAFFKLLKGDIYIIRSGKKLLALESDKLFVGDELRSGKASFAKIQFNDKSLITLGPQSILHIKRWSQKKAGLLKLIQGQIKAQIIKSRNRGAYKLMVQTPTVALGVRGTIFDLDFSPNNKESKVYVTEGEVKINRLQPGEKVNDLEHFLNTSGAQSVKKGQFALSGPSKYSHPMLAPLMYIDMAKFDDKYVPVEEDPLRNTDDIPYPMKAVLKGELSGRKLHYRAGRLTQFYLKKLRRWKKFWQETSLKQE